MNIYDTREGARLLMNRQNKGHWNRWGPFLSERAWGTVREDYSANGDAWSYFPHDHARSRAYRWNEDGLAGICDRHQYLCFALALWNGRDPILKERLFGLTGSEGNHGEDVKEYYYYLDNTPTHSYMKYLYKYPQAEYPYRQLVEENRRRTKLETEYELVDTGIFDQGRYFDVVAEYAKLNAEDLLIRISVTNRGPEASPIHVLPTLWFRNTWSWGRDDRRPSIARGPSPRNQGQPVSALLARHWELGEYILCCSGADELLFTENETNRERLYEVTSPTPFVKDAFHKYVVKGRREAVNPAATGTKAAASYKRTVNAGETITLGLRLASMPDASWDLGLHCRTLAHVDPQFAKEQILLMLREWYMHPNGQIPAYEWNFSDVNPPILSLAARAVFETELERTGVADYAFVERVFQKMLLNFTWWVNRKDAFGKNIFQGGFLGMDNIGVFDRDNLPPGYLLGQADGTSWMAAFAKSMLSAALLLAERDSIYEDVASKFWEHYIYIANAMNSRQDPQKSLWDEQDGFFYDHLFTPDHGRFPVRARTMVGFVPLFGVTAVPAATFDRYPAFKRRRQWFIEHRPDLVESVGPMIIPGANNNLIVGFVRTDQLRRMLAYMLDEDEFLSPFGVRAVSRYHLDHPLILNLGDQEYRLNYEPGESMTSLFGGNSNWRGPIWMPVNFLILQALEQYHLYYGASFQVECPTRSGKMKTLDQVAQELAQRLARIFLLDKDGIRAVFGFNRMFNADPHWRDLIPFHEYFHGDTGRGCGASHQTGWTGLIAQILIAMHGEGPT